MPQGNLVSLTCLCSDTPAVGAELQKILKKYCFLVCCLEAIEFLCGFFCFLLLFFFSRVFQALKLNCKMHQTAFWYVAKQEFGKLSKWMLAAYVCIDTVSILLYD